MNVLHDIRFGVRLLAKDRWFTAAATTALALGIGMNATVFTLVNSFLFRSLPFEDPDRVMYVGEGAVMAVLGAHAVERLEYFVPVDGDVDLGAPGQQVLQLAEHHAAAIVFADAGAPELLEALALEP